MGLTWKDGVSTLFMGAIAVIYLTFLHGTGVWLISSTRGTATAVFILGMVGGCMLSGAGDLYQKQRSRTAPGLAGDRLLLRRCRVRCRSGRAGQWQHDRARHSGGRHGLLVARSDHPARAHGPPGAGAQP